MFLEYGTRTILQQKSPAEAGPSVCVLLLCLDELVIQVAKLTVSGEVNPCLVNVLCHLLDRDGEPVFAGALLALADYGPGWVVGVELDCFECVGHLVFHLSLLL